MKIRIANRAWQESLKLCRNQSSRGGFLGGCGSVPDVIVLLHLHDVVHDVAFVMFEPVIQTNLTGRHLSVSVPLCPFLKRNEQLVCRLPQAADDFKRLSCALMGVP